MKTLGLVFGTLACAAVFTAAAENPLKLWYNSDAGTEFTNAFPHSPLATAIWAVLFMGVSLKTLSA